MTAVSERKAAPSRTASIPWVLRPWALFAVNVLCFVVNWAAVYEEPYGYHIMLTCRNAAERTDVLTSVLFGVYALAGLSVILAVLWCRRKQARGGRWVPILLTAAAITVFALYNLRMGYVTQTVFLRIPVPCTR